MSISALLASTPMKWAVGGWSFFLVENLVLSENRTVLISNLGDDGYHYLYGACSTAAASSILYAYLRKIKVNSMPLRWPIGHPVPRGMLLGGFLLQAVGVGLASQVLPRFQVPVAYSGSTNEEDENHTAAGPQPPIEENAPKREWKVRCPFDFTDSESITENVTNGNDNSNNVVVEPRGLDRITRHPGLWSMALFGLGNAVMTPSLPRAVWMGMPVFFAWLGAAHTDSRHRRGMGGYLSKELDEKTSNIPFLSMIMGKQQEGAFRKLITEEGKGLNAALGVGMVGVWVLGRGRGSLTRIQTKMKMA